MSTVTTLTAKTAPGFRVDASSLLPAALAALPLADIGWLMLPAANETVAVGDLFDVARRDASPGDASPGDASQAPMRRVIVVVPRIVA